MFNISSMNAQALFAANIYDQLTQQINQLNQESSTGLQINSPADNPAMYAVSTNMDSQIGGIQAAQSNVKQATNLMQTASGALQQDTQLVQQIQSLATQASAGTLSGSQLQDIQNQIQDLLANLNNNAQTTNYNDVTLLNGQYGASVSFTANTTVTALSLGTDSGQIQGLTAPTGFSLSVSDTVVNGATVDVVNISGVLNGVTINTTASINVGAVTGTVDLQVPSGTNGLPFSLNIDVNQAALTSTATAMSFTLSPAAQTLEFQVGQNNSPSNQISVNMGAATAQALGLNNVNVTTQAGAQYAITQAQNALTMLNNASAQNGAVVDQLNYTGANLATELQNLQASYNNIVDANMPQVASQLAQDQTNQQLALQSMQYADKLPSLMLSVFQNLGL